LEAWWAERVVSIISSELSKDYQVDLITLKNVNFYDLPNWVNYISLSNVKNNLLMFLLIPYYVLKFKKHLNKNNYKSWISSLEIANFVNILSNKNAIIAFEISIYFFSWFIWQIYKLLIKFLYPKAKKIKVNSEPGSGTTFTIIISGDKKWGLQKWIIPLITELNPNY